MKLIKLHFHFLFNENIKGILNYMKKTIQNFILIIILIS